jgi:exodeoxyribonuclease VII large subunit
MTEFEARGHKADSPLSVSQLNWYLKQVVEEAAPRVWLEGEVGDLSRPSSGHIYFSLKDDRSQIRAVIWRSAAQLMKLPLKDGMSIICRGAVEVYPPRGTYQIVIDKVEAKGVGALQLAFQELHKKLAQAGLFDPARKKPLPKFPKRIGFVTSPSGAAIHDFLESADQLWSDFQLFVIPARVQGDTAASEIARGIKMAERIRPKLDLLIVGRGGGSMEDLWSFNEEIVVRALAGCSIPTVSAVGHEIDVTLSDLAADARAMTPSQAAQLVLPKRSEVQGTLEQWKRRVHNLAKNRLQRMRLQVDHLASRTVIAKPHFLHQRRRQQVDDWEKQLKNAFERLLKNRRQRLGELARAAEALSPLGVLQRGYSLTHIGDGLSDGRSESQSDSRTVRSSKDVAIGDLITTRLSEGIVVSRVEATDDNPK